MIIVILTGCFNAQELDELGISLLMGFDIEDGKVLLTAEIVDPSYTTEISGQGGESPVKYVQGTGNNLLEAFRDISLKFGRRVYAAHNKVLIFGEEVAKEGIVTYLDELFRDREQRENAYILIAKGAKAYEVMGINSGLELIPANYIRDIIQETENNPKGIDMNIIDYLKNYYHDGINPTIGVIEKKSKKTIDQISEEAASDIFELSVLGSAIFDQDKLVGYLNGNDTKSLNFILDNIGRGIITFELPLLEEEKLQNQEADRDLSTVVIINNNTKNDIELKEDELLLKTSIELKCALGEVIGKIDVSKEENLIRIADTCSKTIEENIEAAVKKVQKDYGIDIFGFGIVFHRKYPEQWEEIKDNWDEIFADADFEIEVESKIIRTGLINRPVTD